MTIWTPNWVALKPGLVEARYGQSPSLSPHPEHLAPSPQRGKLWLVGNFHPYGEGLRVGKEIKGPECEHPRWCWGGEKD